MNAVRRTQATVLVAFAVILSCRYGATAAVDPPDGWVSEIRTIRDGGGRLDWSREANLIVFDMLGEDGFYDVYVMRPDGSDVRALTTDHPDLPNRNIAQPAWHPSGNYVAFQAEKGEHKKTRLKRVVEPGAGVYNDLWVLVRNTGRAYPLRVVPNDRGAGILHAHFSEDGRRISWSELTKAGSLRGKRNLLGHWKLMVADFSVQGDRPKLENVRSYQPGEPAFYENHGFSHDGTKLLFSSNFEAVNRLNCHIYTLDLKDERLVRLTDGKLWNEHAVYSPDGRHIAWMVKNKGGGTDYWLMRSDGSDKRRLTYFNEKKHPHYAGDTTVVADLAWSPDGTALAAYKRMGGGLEKITSPKSIVLIELDVEKLEAAGRREPSRSR